jgi:hypothetical protein
LTTFGMFGFLGVLKMLPNHRILPPFYHSVVALLLGVFGKSVNVPRSANLPAIVLLLLATYGIGRTCPSELTFSVAHFRLAVFATS